MYHLHMGASLQKSWLSEASIDRSILVWCSPVTSRRPLSCPTYSQYVLLLLFYFTDHRPIHKMPTTAVSPIPISGEFFSKLGSANTAIASKKATATCTSKYAYHRSTTKAVPPTTRNHPLSNKYEPRTIITACLFQTNPYKNSTNVIIQTQLQLRLINRQYASWGLRQTFQRLSFREFQNVRTITFQHIRTLLDMGTSGKHVRVLDFTGCKSLTDAIALVGIEASPLIRDLRLNQCPVLSDAVFRLAVCKLRRLEMLDVSQSRKLSGRGLLSCIRSTRFPADRLCELRLASMNYVDNTIMEDVCKCCKNLQLLDVDNTGLSDSFLTSVRMYNANLVQLHAGNNDFSNQGIVNFVDSHNKRDPLLQLVELDVSNSDRLGDPGVLAVCGAFSNTLEVLKIAHFEDRFSVRALHTITQSLPQLKCLDLRFCKNIRPCHIRDLIYSSEENVEIVR